MIVLLTCAAIAGCEPAAPALDASDALSTEDLPMTEEAARKVAASGDPASVRASSSQLVAHAYKITAPAWREAYRARYVAAERQAGRAPTPAQVEWEADNRRNGLLSFDLLAMEIVGGPDAVAYCLWLGENASAPVTLRRAALRVLVRHADRNDPAVRARAQAIWASMAAYDVQSSAR